MGLLGALGAELLFFSFHSTFLNIKKQNYQSWVQEECAAAANVAIPCFQIAVDLKTKSFQVGTVPPTPLACFVIYLKIIAMF